MVTTNWGPVLLALTVALCAPAPARGQSAAARALQFAPKTPVTAKPTHVDELRAAQGDMLNLPALNDLIDAARARSPQQAYLDKAVAIETERQRMMRLDNFKAIGVNGDIFKGTQDVYSLNSDGGPIVPYASNQDRFNAQISLSVRWVPANYLINRTNQRISRLEAERHALLADQRADAFATEIAHLHGQALKSLELMDLFAESTEVMQANGELAKQQFDMGNLTVAEYSAVMNAMIEATAKFQNARADFRTYYQTLMTKVYGRVP